MFNFDLQLFGIDYLVCDNCGEAFPDCISYEYCDKCGATFCEYCSDELGLVRDEETDVLTNCPICSGDVINETEFIEWLINTYCFAAGKTSDEVKEEFKQYKRGKHE